MGRWGGAVVEVVVVCGSELGWGLVMITDTFWLMLMWLTVYGLAFCLLFAVDC